MINENTDHMSCDSNMYVCIMLFKALKETFTIQREKNHYKKLNSVQQRATICSSATKNH